jgi:hypothetical protein
MLQREYHLWVQAGEIWHLLLKADKLARPTRTEFPLCAYVPTINQFASCCTLTSNLDRSEFELWREEGAKGRTRTRLLCSVSRLESLSGHKCLLVYLMRSGKLYRQGGKTLPELYR